MFQNRNRIGLGCDEAELPCLAGVGCDDAGDILGFIDIAVIASDVLGHAVFPDFGTSMKDYRLRELRRDLEHEVPIAVRRREDQRCVIERDHALHTLLDFDRFGYALFLDDGYSSERFQRAYAFGMGLIPAVIVLRANIESADNHLVGGERFPDG